MDHVSLERSGPVFEIRLNRPEKKNALTVEMYQALSDGLAEAEADEAVRVILISGEGDAFTAGNDLKDFLERPPTGQESPTHQLLQALLHGRKPIVAAVHGFAIGIGTTMLLHCDLVYAAEGTRFQVPFVPLGISPEAGSSMLLPERIGYARAAEMLLLAEPIFAEEAERLGLLTRVFPAESLMAEARSRAERLAEMPPEAVRESKEIMRRAFTERVGRHMAAESDVFIRRLRSDEARSAMEAFFQKRG